MAEDGWKLRWLAGDNPKGRSYDVQVRRKGATTWTYVPEGTTAGVGRFDPGRASGRCGRARSRAPATSGWSPVVTLP